MLRSSNILETGVFELYATRFYNLLFIQNKKKLTSSLVIETESVTPLITKPYTRYDYGPVTSISHLHNIYHPISFPAACIPCLPIQSSCPAHHNHVAFTILTVLDNLYTWVG